jgi:DNA-binding transcriptional ArsR family regulator
MTDRLTPEKQAEYTRLLILARGLDPQAADRLREALEAKEGFAEDPAKPPLDLLTIGDILNTEWPEPVWAVPNILPVGLTILAGRPKVGKSWLALQIALSVASGGYALGEHVEAGPVLYLALEDPPRRLKERMIKQGWGPELPAEFMPMGQFEKQIDDLRNGGGERLARQIDLKGYRFVVIDTLSRSVYGDQNDVAEMTLALTPLQAIAHSLNCAVLLVDHHRKVGGADPDAITDILGSTAKGAMADTAWGLYKERGKAGAKLAITGRDVEERTLALSWDYDLGCWQCEGDADALELTERRQEILDALEVLGKAKVGDIARATDQNRGNTYKRLQDLTHAGLVKRYEEGNNVYYTLPTDDP